MPAWWWGGFPSRSLPALAAILPYLEKQTDKLWKHKDDSFSKDGGWEGRSFVVIIQMEPYVFMGESRWLELLALKTWADTGQVLEC